MALGLRCLLCAACLLAPACSKGGGGVDGVLSAWKSAGLAPSAFETVSGSTFGKASCRAGKIGGIDATLCEFPDADAAKRAEGAGLAQVRNATGLALAQGKLLLVVVDSQHADPSGKRINQIAKIFRNR